MAKIMKNEKQEQALITIKNMLSEVSQINALTAAGGYVISSSEDKRSHYVLDTAHYDALTQILLQRKRVLARKIPSIARENRIELDEEELAVLEMK